MKIEIKSPEYIGIVVKNNRKESKNTLAVFAKTLGVDAARLSRIEAGKANMSIKETLRILGILRLKVMVSDE